MKKIFLALLIAVAGSSYARDASAEARFSDDFLIKLTDAKATTEFIASHQNSNAKVEDLGNSWVHVILNPANRSQHNLDPVNLTSNPKVLRVQPNYKLHLLENPGMEIVRQKLNSRGLLGESSLRNLLGPQVLNHDNPPIEPKPKPTLGSDPLASKQWGMQDIGAPSARQASGHFGEGVIVAVIDSGVDYNHPDLSENIWRNPGEQGADAQGHDKSNNQIDDDKNGYVDDVIGWDFSANDNKPYDFIPGLVDVILKGGNPGHGTHCAGNVAARSGNGIGIAGVAPQAQIMPVRFINEYGQGDTSDAIKSINYAVKMGAKVLSSSWGSTGGDGSTDSQDQNKALADAIQSAQDAGALFVAAAGNGRKGTGYDNDTDPASVIPASYRNENIISVAAIDRTGQAAKFSNYGVKSVDLAAPGVDIFSTTVHGHYDDAIVRFLGFKIPWDGTSMAAPHVSGAAALYWSAHPQASWQEVKKAILDSAKKVDSFKGRTVTEGKLDVQTLMKL